ncbi:amidase [Amycolatopsis thermoflava]|uniref:amidase n=1 Tax=Amycolatopsis thermoflava TaxID=84480 RepID=UPI00366A1EC9
MSTAPLPDAVATAAAVTAGTISPVELVEAVLERVERIDPVLNSYTTLLRGRALARAHAIGRTTGTTPRPLPGLPVAVKDNLHVAGAPTSLGVYPPAVAEPVRSAEAVRLLERAGAIVLGKTNLHQLAYGATGDVSAFGPVRNPHDPARMAGGSSGGSAAAVAAGLCAAALGTDTGGSVRVPAALCGVVGLKPTRGAVGTGGVVPLGPTLDCVGLLTRTVRDCAALFAVLTGRTTPRDTAARERLDGYRIGVPDAFYFDDVQPAVGAACLRALDTLHRLGAELVPVGLPDMGLVTAAQRRVLAAEAADGLGEFTDRRGESIHPEVLHRIRGSPRATRGDRELTRAARRYFANDVFGQVDVVVTPTVPVVAPPLHRRTVELPSGDADVGSTLTRNTAAANLLGLPALSVPCGRCPGGWPVGLQLLGAPCAERLLFTVAAAFERTRPREDQPHGIPA